MKHIFALSLMLVIAISCMKLDNFPGSARRPYTPVDTINSIQLSAKNPFAWDTTGNCLVGIDFYKNQVIHKNTFSNPPADVNLGPFSLSDVPERKKYYLKYIGTVPLFNADSIIGRGVYNLNFTVDKSLLNKPVFEARQFSNDSLYKTYVYADSGIAIVGYYYPDTAEVERWTRPENISVASVVKAFNFYLSPTKLAPNRFAFSFY